MAEDITINDYCKRMRERLAQFESKYHELYPDVGYEKGDYADWHGEFAGFLEATESGLGFCDEPPIGAGGRTESEYRDTHPDDRFPENLDDMPLRDLELSDTENFGQFCFSYVYTIEKSLNELLHAINERPDWTYPENIKRVYSIFVNLSQARVGVAKAMVSINQVYPIIGVGDFSFTDIVTNEETALAEFCQELAKLEKGDISSPLC